MSFEELRRLGPAEQYVACCHGLAPLLDGLIDSYFGPPELAALGNRLSGCGPASIGAELRRLESENPRWEMDPQRRSWLAAALRGVITTADRFAGESIAFLEEVERCYEIRPSRISEDELNHKHRQIDALLGGTGDLAERVHSRRSRLMVPAARVAPLVQELVSVMKHRAHQRFELPTEEAISFTFVSDKPWSGFNVYEGRYRSQVAINVDVPQTVIHLAHLVAHESYAGHHLEGCLKELGLLEQRGWVEHSIHMIGTPSCVVAEGLADLGLSAMFPNWATEFVDLFADLGVPWDAASAEALGQLAEHLLHVRGELAARLHVDGESPERVVALAARWLLIPVERAEQVVRFLVDPTWRAYVYCYSEGLALCREFAELPEGFERLVTEPLSPSRMRAEMAQRAHQGGQRHGAVD